MVVKSYDKIALNANIVLDLPFFEGAGVVAHDVSKYHYNGAFKAAGEPLWTLTGGIYLPYYDGINDYILCSSAWSPAAGFSFECWYKPDTGYGNHTASKLIFKGYHGMDVSNTTGKTRFSVYNTVPTEFYTVDTTALTIGVWYHLVGTLSLVDNKVRLYKNGTLVGTPTTFSGTLPDCGAIPFSIGGVAAGNRQAKGIIGQARANNACYAPTEVSKRYLSTKSRYGL